MLYEHQQQGLERLQNKTRCAFFWDMGTGKTFVGAQKSIDLNAPVILVICQKSKIADWVNHYKENFKFVTAYNLTNKKQYCEFFNGEKRAFPVVGVINYELVWRRPDFAKLRRYTLLLDESSIIQNSTSKQSRFIVRRLKPQNVVLLSGTPCSGKYENLWTQSRLLGWNITKTAFNERYINFKKINIGCMTRLIVDPANPYKHTEELKRNLRIFGADFLKTDDVITLPKQNFITVNVPKSADYKKFLKNDVLKLPDGTELIGDTTLTKRLRLRQLCGQYSADKLQALRDLSSSTNDRIIIFYNFTQELQEIRHVIPENRPVSVVNGATKDLTAYEENPDSVTIIQYQAGSMGLNLQKANKIIYYSPPEKTDYFEQSKKRIHRIGQSLPCFYYMLCCEKSIETAIYKALQQRKNFTDDLFKLYERGGATRTLTGLKKSK